VRIADDRDGVNLGRGSRRRLVSMASETTGYGSDAVPRQGRFERRPDLFGDCFRGATVLVFRMTTILRMMSGAVACREHFMRLGSDIVAPARAIGLLAARAVVPAVLRRSPTHLLPCFQGCPQNCPDESSFGRTRMRTRTIDSFLCQSGRCRLLHGRLSREGVKESCRTWAARFRLPALVAGSSYRTIRRRNAATRRPERAPRLRAMR
jgi:hypothetical protein